ncbi:MAG: hypothetical protein IKX30_13325, partial [Victivallales bacterium]|nr:hypothetical protein [Victivallales bacterium]
MTLFSLARSVTNRRAAGAVCIIRNQCLLSSLNFQDIIGPAARHLFILCVLWSDFSCSFVVPLDKHYQQTMDFKLPHDILCSRAAHDNRRAAGAVCIIRNQCLLSSLNFQDIIGPAARHLFILCVLWSDFS